MSQDEHKVRTKAAAARAFNATYGEHVSAIAEGIIAKWRQSGLDQSAYRERLFDSLKALDMVSDAIQASISSGQVLDASAALNDIEAQIKG